MTTTDRASEFRAPIYCSYGLRSITRTPRGRLVSVVALVVVVGVLTAFLAQGGSDQAQVSADMLPVVAGAGASAVFVDCSTDNLLGYFADNPCETFVLLRSDRFASPQAFLAAEATRLRGAGWRHPTIAPPIDYDVDIVTASLDQSWFAPGHRACAYVAVDAAAVAAEGKVLLPFDPYDNPHGMLAFYETARAAQSAPALWVRLRPPVMVERGAC